MWHSILTYQLTRIVLGIFGMQPFCQLLIRVGLDAECFRNRQHLEQERELFAISLTDFWGQQCLVILD